METKVKSNSVVTAKIDAVAGTVTFKAIGVDSPPLVVRWANLSAPVREMAGFKGMVQRISNRAAIPRDEKTGKSATPQDKYDAMASLVAHYNSGSEDWGMALGGGTRLDPVILAALGEVMGKDREAVLAFIVAGATKHEVPQGAYLAKLGTGTRVQPVVDRMRAEAAGDVDPDAELEGVDGEE